MHSALKSTTTSYISSYLFLTTKILVPCKLLFFLSTTRVCVGEIKLPLSFCTLFLELRSAPLHRKWRNRPITRVRRHVSLRLKKKFVWPASGWPLFYFACVCALAPDGLVKCDVKGDVPSACRQKGPIDRLGAVSATRLLRRRHVCCSSIWRP